MTIVLAWLLASFAAAMAAGTYWLGGVMLLTVALGLLLFGSELDVRWRGKLGLTVGGAAAITLALLAFSSTLKSDWALFYQPEPTRPLYMTVHLVLLAIVLSYALPTGPAKLRVFEYARYSVAVGLVCATLVHGVLSLPDPDIDVWYFLVEGGRGLLQGQNPYAMTFSPAEMLAGVADRSTLPPGYDDPAYNFDVYSYLPVTLLLTLPGALAGDVRWVMLAAVVLSAMLVRGVARCLGAGVRTAELVSIAYLSYPGTMLMVQRSWIEPLIVCTWLGALYLQLAGKWRWSGVLAFFVMGIKQYDLPLLLSLKAAEARWRTLVLATVAVGSLSLPFFLWGPGAFLWDILWYQLQAPMREDALSWNGYLINVFNLALPGWFSLIVPALGGLLLWLKLRRGWGIAASLRLTVAFYLLMFLSNKFAFANYYYLLQAVLLVAAVGTLVPAGQTVATRPTDGLLCWARAKPEERLRESQAV